MFDVDDLNDHAVTKNLQRLKKELKDYIASGYATENAKGDDSDERLELKFYIDLFDHVDNDDYFGTEGWRHRFGFEN